MKIRLTTEVGRVGRIIVGAAVLLIFLSLFYVSRETLTKRVETLQTEVRHLKAENIRLRGQRRSGHVSRTDSQKPGTPMTIPPDDPTISVWNGGVYLAGIKPFLLFAAWEDGTVLRRNGRRVADGLSIGRVSPGRIDELMGDVEESGFFAPPIAFGLIAPDGPELRIAARRASQKQILSYHGDDDRNDADAMSSPSRDQVESFVSMWNRVMNAVAAISPESDRQYRGVLQLDFPVRRSRCQRYPPSWPPPSREVMGGDPGG